MIAECAEHLELPTSEILRKLAYDELLNVVDIEDWFRPFYWDPKTHKWYFDNEDVFSYIELINRLNQNYRVKMIEIIRMANDIAKFHTAFPPEEAVQMIAEHLNKFWAPALRFKFFELLQTQKADFHPLVVDSAAFVRCDKSNPIDRPIMDLSGTGG